MVRFKLVAKSAGSVEGTSNQLILYCTPAEVWTIYEVQSQLNALSRSYEWMRDKDRYGDVTRTLARDWLSFHWHGAQVESVERSSASQSVVGARFVTTVSSCAPCRLSAVPDVCLLALLNEQVRRWHRLRSTSTLYCQSSSSISYSTCCRVTTCSNNMFGFPPTLVRLFEWNRAIGLFISRTLTV